MLATVSAVTGRRYLDEQFLTARGTEARGIEHAATRAVAVRQLPSAPDAEHSNDFT